MKSILVISMGSNTAEAIVNQLVGFLPKDITIDHKLLKNISEEHIQHDIIVFTSEFTCKLCHKYIDVNIPYVTAGRVINHKNIKGLISLSAGTRVLLVNDSKDSAKEAIAQLIDIGLDHLVYIPYYPQIDEYESLSIAITPGETQLSPHCVSTIMDIGTRIIDIQTIYEIHNLLGIKAIYNESLVVEYIKDIIEISKSIDTSRRAEKATNEILETIFDTVEYGIAYLDRNFNFIKVNSKLQFILGKKRKDILNKSINTFIDNFSYDATTENHVGLTISDECYIADIEKIIVDNSSGYLMIFNKVNNVQSNGKSAKALVPSNLHTFEDYITIDNRVLESLDLSKKFAKTEATILIEGENGTGKEILAQGIHMHSYRRDKPFIPVNITAISPNLLESELFGYVEGAFTGASKNGKIGLFEIANGGTIFIDEIGDAPMDIQVKLLRVLQEKKIRRIGGMDEISVDIRVITATNKDLLSLVDKGIFREDLFFRLNIIPIRTLPLRMRLRDIEHLLLHFFNIYFRGYQIGSVDEVFDGDTLSYLNNYRWRGNVRELINLVEYLSYIYNGTPLDLNSLPHYFLDQTINNSKRLLSEEEVWILDCIYNQPGIGRVALAKLAKESKQGIGEGKIRSILSNLLEDKLILQNNDKRGSKISNMGLTLLSKYI